MASPEFEGILRRLSSQTDFTTISVDELRAGLDAFGDGFRPADGVAICGRRLGDVSVEELSTPCDGPTTLYFHGGGYIAGSAKSHRHLASLVSQNTGGVVISVDYRRAPECPAPAAVIDALAVYDAVLRDVDPRSIAFCGDSAGGGLAYATLLAARARNLPMPGCIATFSPLVNLAIDAKTIAGIECDDPVMSLKGTKYCASHYVPDGGLDDPSVSPLFGELHDLPPSLIQIGGQEILLPDAQRFHQKLLAAGVDSILDVWPEMVHVWQLFWPLLPEGREAVAGAAEFIRAHCGR